MERTWLSTEPLKIDILFYDGDSTVIAHFFLLKKLSVHQKHKSHVRGQVFESIFPASWCR